MSKESRRAARNAARTATGTPASGQRASTGQRPPSTGPSGTPRAGRRERTRRFEERPFLERYRALLIGAVVVVVAVVAAGLVFAGATQAAYSCAIEWEPTPTASPAAGASPRLGYAQDSMGNRHTVSKPQPYVYCPPASGNHFNVVGQGPITPRVFGPNDSVAPMNWLHNLEHGGLVVLYRGDSDGATPAGQDRFKQFFESFPPGPICNTPPGRLSPVIARFDDMKWPFAALVWGRVLPLEQWDPQQVLDFYATESVRLDANGDYVAPPEPAAAGCPQPSHSAPPSPQPSASPAAPSGSTTPSAVPDSSGSAAPSPASS